MNNWYFNSLKAIHVQLQSFKYGFHGAEYAKGHIGTNFMPYENTKFWLWHEKFHL